MDYDLTTSLFERRVDLGLVVLYLIFIVAIGFLFRGKSDSPSNYFRGGGKLLWWMTGASAFMVQFSAWTFTGAAGKAYTDGLAVAVIFIGNAIGYFLSFLLVAEIFRQTRCITPVDAIRRRYGAVNEQVFTWAQVPLGVIQAGIWLNGLAIFASAVFGVSIETTIIITGLVVMFVSLTGGAWAVVASDYVQMLVIMAVSITAVIFVGFEFGLTRVIVEFPAELFTNDLNYAGLFVIWALMSITKQIFSTNNMFDASRYLVAKDSANARKAALLAAILMFAGTFIWFLPPMATALMGVDLQAAYPTLGSKAADAAYLAFVDVAMPVGMVGIMMAALFSATMSSMDSGLNRSAGIMSINFYKPVIRRGSCSDAELVIFGKVTTVLFGVLIVLVALFIASLKELSLFDIMLQMGSLIQMPILIPLFLAIFVRKVPDWAPWATVLVGLGVSLASKYLLTPDLLATLGGVSFTGRESADLVFIVSMLLHLVVTTGFFFWTRRFHDDVSERRQQEIDAFFEDIATPVEPEEADAVTDQEQRRKLGTLSMIYGATILLLPLIPQPDHQGRAILGFALTGGIVLGLGALLRLSARGGRG
ncbi:sodium:solute symporter family transporter [Mangrovicoccus algicola]|uniref:Transporter n=1 Tax=Mangrovicoccus algicola TaxID=2771008 RepID=A0A8J6Z5M8_9RHOB|nr:transporter [Mangrovicoccus algicola]MBE3636770.1 transporter [Mangrovicoccus algicola]